MIYKGYIRFTSDTEYDECKKAGIDCLGLLRFRNNGFWVAGSRRINSYVICDKNGDDIPEFEHIQFSKSRTNIFYIESIN